MNYHRHRGYPRISHTHQYIGKKIRRVRWQKSSSSLDNASKKIFATASWDENGPYSSNEVAIWEIVADDIDAEETRPQDRSDDAISLTADTSKVNWKFVQLASLKIRADVQEIQFLNDEHLLIATANGDLIVAKWIRENGELRQTQIFPTIHGEGEACVGFSLFGDDAISIGSNSTLKRLSIASMIKSTHRGNMTVEMRDDVSVEAYHSKVGSLLCIEHTGVNEIITGNAVGQLQLWDLRQRGNLVLRQLQSSIHSSGAVTAIRSHPGQRHVVVAGYQFGKIVLWDLRNPTEPLPSSAFEIHEGPIWSLAFHPIYSSHLYSGGNDGVLYHWDASQIRLNSEAFSTSPWLLPMDELRDNVKLTNFLPANNKMPINSVDVLGDSILVGVDDESVWMIKNIPVS